MEEPDFLWVRALDFYICRRSHNVDFFIPDLNDEFIEQRVIDHVAWRFHSWYKNNEVRALAVGALSTEISRVLADQQMKGIYLYSAHDVTLMPLLALLDEGYLLNESTHANCWPP